MIEALNKYKSLIVLIPMGVITILNKYFIDDRHTNWLLAMLALSFYLCLYSYTEWKKSKTKINLIVLLIFLAELVGVIFGFNLSTNFFSEIIIVLIVVGLFSKFKR